MWFRFDAFLFLILLYLCHLALCLLELRKLFSCDCSLEIFVLSRVSDFSSRFNDGMVIKNLVYLYRSWLGWKSRKASIWKELRMAVIFLKPWELGSINSKQWTRYPVIAWKLLFTVRPTKNWHVPSARLSYEGVTWRPEEHWCVLYTFWILTIGETLRRKSAIITWKSRLRLIGNQFGVLADVGQKIRLHLLHYSLGLVVFMDVLN